MAVSENGWSKFVWSECRQKCANVVASSLKAGCPASTFSSIELNLYLKVPPGALYASAQPLGCKVHKLWSWPCPGHPHSTAALILTSCRSEVWQQWTSFGQCSRAGAPILGHKRKMLCISGGLCFTDFQILSYVELKPPTRQGNTVASNSD